MIEGTPPDDVEALAEARAKARGERDWRTADDLKARIEAAGWNVVDDGLDYALAPARPPDLVVDGTTWYGSADSVPSLLEEPETAPASIIVIATVPDVPGPEALAGLRDVGPEGTQVVVIAAGDSAPEPAAGEVVLTAGSFGPGEALEVGLRRSLGKVIIVLEPDRLPAGDVVTPLREALADPDVAIAGIEAIRSTDLRRYGPAEPGEATAVRSGCYAFRRSDAAALGEIDCKLNLPGSVATWISLELRDRGRDVEPRKVVALELPLATAGSELPEDHARLARRDAYRLARRFADRQWLAGEAPPEGRLVGDRTGEDDRADDRDEGDDSAEP